jgi:hypothetical protein
MVAFENAFSKAARTGAGTASHETFCSFADRLEVPTKKNTRAQGASP